MLTSHGVDISCCPKCQNSLVQTLAVEGSRAVAQSTKTEDQDPWELFQSDIQVVSETGQATGTSSVFGSLDKFHQCQWQNSLTGPVLKIKKNNILEQK